MKITRNEFIRTMAGASAAFAGFATTSSFVSIPAAQITDPSMHGLSLGVSVYSYTPEIQRGEMNFEKCLADISEMGGEYVEILGMAHVAGYPNPSVFWINQFFGLLEKYNLKQSAYDTFCDTMFHKDRLLAPQELLDLLIMDMKVASQLGYHVFRQQVAPYPADDPAESYIAPYVMSTDAMKYLELAIPYCEKYDIKLALELHSPTQLRSKWIDGCLELIERTKTKHVGFCPDFSSFTWRPGPTTVERLIQQGCKKEIVEYIISAYQQRLGPDKTMEVVKKMGGGETEQNYASKAGLFHSSNNDPKDLKIIAPWIYHTHAKFYLILDDLSSDYCMNYPEILKAYVDNGVKGVLSSESEGYMVLGKIIEREDISRSTHIRMQHAMIRKILASI
jgi:sugar phosphate isomerase/epimerase